MPAVLTLYLFLSFFSNIPLFLSFFLFLILVSISWFSSFRNIVVLTVVVLLLRPASCTRQGPLYSAYRDQILLF